MATHHQNGADRSPELGEELVSHAFLDYINSILMEDTCGDSDQLPLQEHGALSCSYQRILNDFYDILREPTPSSCSVQLPHGSVGANYRSHDADGLCTDSGRRTLYHAAYASLLVSNATSTLDTESMVRDRAMHFEPNTLLDQYTTAEEEYDQELQNMCASYVHVAKTSNGTASHVATCRGYDGCSHMPTDKDITQIMGPRTSLKTGARKKDVSFVRNTDLEAEVHAQLFDEWPGRDTKAVALAALRHQMVKGREDAALANPVDLKALLLNSAKALGEGNMQKATELLQKVQQQGASPHGSGLQRVAHYFREALIARMSGMGSTLYKAIASTSQLPSAMATLKAYKFVFEVCPYLKIAHYFANQHILKAASGASRLHIVDYGIFYGFQWPCLLYALAHREGGPPHIRITGIELPSMPVDINPAATTEGTGWRLMEYAKTYHVPFEYHAISASNWEDVEPSSLNILPDEVLVVNTFNRLRHLHDECAASSSPRDQLLIKLQSLNPHLLVTGFMNASHISPFFAPRFREALHYYANKFDTIHTTVLDDSPERLLFEREVMGRAILNVVACEGVERVERPETYKQWETRLKRAGFQQQPMVPSVLSTARAIMKGYHKDFSLLHPSNMWMLLGWRGRTMQALSAWEPAGSPQH